jgi:hypothetical protein
MITFRLDPKYNPHKCTNPRTESVDIYQNGKKVGSIFPRSDGGYWIDAPNKLVTREMATKVMAFFRSKS